MVTKIKIKKLSSEAKIPVYAHPGDAGLDFYAAEDVSIKPGERAAVPTGVAIALPERTVGLFWDKSGLAINQGIKTIGGVIDSGYRGEIKILLINLGQEEHLFQKGDKVAQMIVQKFEACEVEETTDLDETARAQGGFGSTGK